MKKSFKEITRATIAQNKWAALIFACLFIPIGIIAIVQATQMTYADIHPAPIYATGIFFLLLSGWLLWGFILNSKK